MCLSNRRDIGSGASPHPFPLPWGEGMRVRGDNMRHFFLAAGTLWQRELVRFFRQRSRAVGALGPASLFRFLIGTGLGKSFQFVPPSGLGATPTLNYMQNFFPGTIVLIVLFTSIFSTISVIEDRHEGFLQSVMVAPISRASLVLGKIAGGT